MCLLVKCLPSSVGECSPSSWYLKLFAWFFFFFLVLNCILTRYKILRWHLVFLRFFCALLFYLLVENIVVEKSEACLILFPCFWVTWSCLFFSLLSSVSMETFLYWGFFICQLFSDFVSFSFLYPFSHSFVPPSVFIQIMCWCIFEYSTLETSFLNQPLTEDSCQKETRAMLPCSRLIGIFM